MRISDISPLVDELLPRVIQWRRYFHENPELGNREFGTAAFVAKTLRELNFDHVQEKVAVTGVVGILKGKIPGGHVVGLRADMDALPVEERNDLPFKSRVKTVWNGKETGVMHACGHDVHTANLLGVAALFSSKRAELRGTFKFIFQPAEEMPPDSEEGGATLMVKEGVMDDVDFVFGLHVIAGFKAGKLMVRSGPIMASSGRKRRRKRRDTRVKF